MVVRCTNVEQVVPRDSACLGLAGDHESQLKIEAKHGDMCRFNPKVTIDENNYEVVEGNVVELCEKAAKQLGEKSHAVMMDLMPSVPQEALPGSMLTSSGGEDNDDLAQRLHELRR